jgi:hypothetical protein
MSEEQQAGIIKFEPAELTALKTMATILADMNELDRSYYLPIKAKEIGVADMDLKKAVRAIQNERSQQILAKRLEEERAADEKRKALAEEQRKLDAAAKVEKQEKKEADEGSDASREGSQEGREGSGRCREGGQEGSGAGQEGSGRRCHEGSRTQGEGEAEELHQYPEASG